MVSDRSRSDCVKFTLFARNWTWNLVIYCNHNFASPIHQRPTFRAEYTQALGSHIWTICGTIDTWFSIPFLRHLASILRFYQSYERKKLICLISAPRISGCIYRYRLSARRMAWTFGAFLIARSSPFIRPHKLCSVYLRDSQRLSERAWCQRCPLYISCRRRIIWRNHLSSVPRACTILTGEINY